MNGYLITAPVKTFVTATSMGMAVSMYTRDVVSESQLHDAYELHNAPTGHNPDVLTVQRVSKPFDSIHVANALVDAEYFDTLWEAQEAIKEALEKDSATIWVLDNQVA